MAKRKVAVESDDEQNESSQVPKRAKTEDSEDGVQAGTQQVDRKSVVNGKTIHKKARRGDSDDEQEDEENGDTIVAEEDERKFEEDHGERIREQLKARRNVLGGVAEHGIIESVEMHQFMCHRRLTFSFGPQVNFIIGHNGSGKSAVLSAITIALGGKAISTGRGNGLKSFIREGQDAAEVTIIIKNQGEEAYKPQEYGKSIVITRRFTKDGASSWKIKSKDGKTVSTKKEELSAICDHMNIQVDNPLNVLTQDSARQFLSASHPSDKYKFFLRGTQLSQLHEEYDTCLDNINQTKKVLQVKKQAIPDLKAAYREATARYEEATKARKQRDKADELKKELAWAHVATKEDEMTKKIEEVAKMKRRLPKIQEEIHAAEAQFNAASDEIAQYDAEHHDLGDIDHIRTQLENLKNEMRENKTKLSNYKDDERRMNESLGGLNGSIKDFQQRIEEETRKMEAHTQARREEVQKRLTEAKQDVQNADYEYKSILQQTIDKERTMKETAEQGTVTEAKRSNERQQIVGCQQGIQHCREQEKNSYAAYGNNIQEVLNRIKQTRWHGETPVGPIGTFVRLKDQNYGRVLRAQLANVLTSFACTDARDQPILKRILREFRNDNSVIVSGRDLFDFSSGEPPEGVLTALRALEISDPWVLRLIVNSAGIERVVLAPTRKDCDNILLNLRGGGMGWTMNGIRVQRYSDGGGSSSPFGLPGPQDRKNMLLNDTNVTSNIRRFEEEVHHHEVQVKEMDVQIRQLKQEYNTMASELRGLKRQEQVARERLRDLENKRDTLQAEANEEMPAGISGFQQALDEAEAEKVSLHEQFRTLTEHKQIVDDKQKDLLAQVNVLKERQAEFSGRREVIVRKAEQAVAERLKAENGKNHFEQKRDEEQRKIDTADKEANDLQLEYEEWTKQAMKYCDRVPNPRKVDEIQRNLNSVQEALKEREKRQGASVEEMTIEVNKTKADLDNARADLESLDLLNRALKRSLMSRLAKWQEFRRHIALRCKLVFQYHLSNRGYYGKVLFDHQKESLQLKVQTDEQAATQGGADKDPRSLSGGEKSFSTICLLLSLWDSIGCPLRCLDEFDVFMDAVNRRISMRMMIDTANASDKKQYILITPQDMTNIVIGNTVRVHRMPDPERGQGTLDDYR